MSSIWEFSSRSKLGQELLRWDNGLLSMFANWHLSQVEDLAFHIVGDCLSESSWLIAGCLARARWEIKQALIEVAIRDAWGNGP